MFFVSYDSFSSYKKTQDWLPVHAVIVKSNLESGQGVHLDIVVRLLKSNLEIPSDLIYGTFVSQNDYRNFAKEYPVGTKITVFQNPDNAKDVVLKRLDEINPFLYLWVFIGMIALVINIRMLNRQ